MAEATLDHSERDICTKLITPALVSAGWNLHSQIKEEVTLTAGRIVVRGKLTSRGRRKRADYVLYHKPNIPIAVIEAKDATHSVGAGIQQALEYAEMIGVPFAFSTNGRAFLFHDKTIRDGFLEREIALQDIPPPDELWSRYIAWKAIPALQSEIVDQEYFDDASGKAPRYYQTVAVNRVIEGIARGKNRLLLVMATGTGKTYTAFQIIWRLWKGGARKRILFLADRNILVDQTKTNDFKPFAGAMTKISNRQADKSYEIYLSLYQAVTGTDEAANVYKQFSPDFFDLIIVDECHRGSAAADSAWREILEYFSKATQIGLTATPKETKEISNTDYFGEPVYTYSLRQGIEDGFLAPYKVIRYDLDKDLTGYRPDVDTVDRYGHEVEDRIYNQRDFDRKLVLDHRTKLVAAKITEFLKATNRYDKTIVFCEDTEHAERLRQELANSNADLVAGNHRYVMRITGDDLLGKAELDNFLDPKAKHPVIATTSKLLTTGVDAKTCKLIVLDQRIQSMTEFKQIIGRGTRIDEEHGKKYFTIMDFKRATELFADPAFDGDPVQIYEPGDNDPPLPPDENETPAPQLGGLDEEEQLPITNWQDGEPPPGLPRKFYVDGVEVNVLSKRVQYLGPDGKLITESLRSYARKALLKDYRTLEEFLRRWSGAERKQVIIEELEALGVSLEGLRDEVKSGETFSAFDLLCHVAYDQPPLTLKERAEQVKKRNYFAKYEGKARTVLEALLDKYADDDFGSLENARVLQLKPFDQIGTPVEIMKGVFGGKTAYEAAIRDLQTELYRKERNA
ncbi:DEAD/DEAH box helicase (plasmid) [Rhizobium ruizarguesonis]|uniref:EcoAI/FtnUII family type I restriction enzme subunit R n=1 Tax=Rhizobium ruizarguesonis TaxID=2081791 RepID=UPI001031215E|nr:DEAD/DEAH box helicase family protein [Rhizobium ruizarguesonis]TAT97835.1 DEAD/DEAH box helicase [Rhizobium ruizarguesonis]